MAGELAASIPFDDVCGLLRRLGFSERIKASHHIFEMDEIADYVDIQREKGKAKAYQVR